MTSIKLLIVAAAMSFAATSAAAEQTRIVYSGYFETYIPTESLTGATFFSSDGPAIRFKGGGHIAGSIVTHQTAGFEAGFDFRDYPLYLFGQKESSGLRPDISDAFIRSRAELQESLNQPTFDAVSIQGGTLYTACSHRCEAFVVQDDQSEQMLHLTTRGFTQTDLIKFLQGGNDAAK